MGIAVVAALLVAGAAGCKQAEGAIDGIGPWKLSKTTLAKQLGRCDFDHDPVWCYGQPPIKLGGHLADVNLYFASKEPEAKLLEILVDVRACKAGDFAVWLQQNLGDPQSQGPKRMYWENKHAFIAAKVPAESARCELSVVSPTDQARIDKLTAPPENKAAKVIDAGVPASDAAAETDGDGGAAAIPADSGE